ncbi:hypothetical protein FSP39_023803 [Pinctada imbricata]|uniref:Uncharacterized protein n=1 Tax=Pinctada imbricata TaxID=66713 RepID=A0AA88YSW4_PINIB|nr:hypothetical protein FSP39_023803 [Pinctada imbricata]
MESSSPSDSSIYCEKDVPKTVNSWKKYHLESIGIFYDDKVSTISDITTLLKGQIAPKSREIYCKLPDIMQIIIEFTKQLLQFSYKSQYIELYLAEEVSSIFSKFESSVDKFKLKDTNGFLENKSNDRVFRRWTTYTADFLLYLRVFIARLQNVSYSCDMTARKGCFTQLFMSFMNMFLLRAEIGDAYKGEITVKGRRISGIPDVRFPCFSAYNKTIQVVTVAEVKHKSSFCKSGKNCSFSVHDLSDAVLGQHGAQLLIERKNSYFKPAVSGIICIGTCFYLLNIEEEKYVSLQDKVIENRKPSKILYTRPYNFLNAADRCEILELCFWLGYLQLNAYKEMEL